MKSKLLKVAEYLDERGHHKEAYQIRKLAQATPPEVKGRDIPRSELIYDESVGGLRPRTLVEPTREQWAQMARTAPQSASTLLPYATGPQRWPTTTPRDEDEAAALRFSIENARGEMAPQEYEFRMGAGSEQYKLNWKDGAGYGYEIYPNTPDPIIQTYKKDGTPNIKLGKNHPIYRDALNIGIEYFTNNTGPLSSRNIMQLQRLLDSAPAVPKTPAPRTPTAMETMRDLNISTNMPTAPAAGQMMGQQALGVTPSRLPPSRGPAAGRATGLLPLSTEGLVSGTSGIGEK